MRFPAPIALPLLAAGLVAAAGSARAASVVVPLDHSVRLPIAGRAASVVVGNSRIADVTVVDSRTLFATGKSLGSTDVTVVDALGRVLLSTNLAVTVGTGTPVTVHRGVERADLSCAPRCSGGAKPASFGSLIDDMVKTQMAKTSANAQATPAAPAQATAALESAASSPLAGPILPVAPQ